jgi:hypothetical protein
MGLDYTTYAMIIEEICKGWMSIAGVINSHLIMAYIVQTYGTDDMKRHYLPKMASGEKRGGIALTEPNCGSDVGATLHHARAVCRRAERRAVALLDADEGVPERPAVYLNRLSDALFTLARLVNAREGVPEENPEY